MRVEKMKCMEKRNKGQKHKLTLDDSHQHYCSPVSTELYMVFTGILLLIYKYFLALVFSSGVSNLKSD